MIIIIPYPEEFKMHAMWKFKSFQDICSREDPQQNASTV